MPNKTSHELQVTPRHLRSLGHFTGRPLARQWPQLEPGRQVISPRVKTSEQREGGTRSPKETLRYGLTKVWKRPGRRHLLNCFAGLGAASSGSELLLLSSSGCCLPIRPAPGAGQTRFSLPPSFSLYTRGGRLVGAIARGWRCRLPEEGRGKREGHSSGRPIHAVSRERASPSR